MLLMPAALREEEISEEENTMPQIPSSTMYWLGQLGSGLFRSSRLLRVYVDYYFCVGCVVLRAGSAVSDVINSRLKPVIITTFLNVRGQAVCVLMPNRS
jgi:hypothetical protein